MTQLKKKVVLRTKVAQEETPEVIEKPKVTIKRKQPIEAPTPVATPPDPKPKTGKVIGGIAAAAAVVGVVCFFGIKNSGNTKDDNNTIPTEQVAQESNPKESSDPVSETVSVTPTSGEVTSSVNGDEKRSNTECSGTKESSKPASPNTECAQTSKPTSPVSKGSAVSVTLSAPISDNVEENALRAIRGDFGNGIDRKNALGEKYAEVQSRVNEYYKEGLI